MSEYDGLTIIEWMELVKESEKWERIRTSAIAVRFFKSDRAKTRREMRKLEEDGLVKASRHFNRGEIMWSICYEG